MVETEPDRESILHRLRDWLNAWDAWIFGGVCIGLLLTLLSFIVPLPVYQAKLDPANTIAPMQFGQNNPEKLTQDTTDTSVSQIGAARRQAKHHAPKPAKLHTGQKLHINHASLPELMRLPGVGPVMAQRILDTRKQLGGFQSLDQLRQVKGIGKKKFAKLQPFIVL